MVSDRNAADGVGCLSGVIGWLPSGWQLAVRYVLSALRRDSGGWLVGMLSLTLVVGFSAVVQSAVASGPAIFLKLSEDTAGEADLMLLPSFSTAAAEPVSPLLGAGVGGGVGSAGGSPLLNHSAIRSLLAENEDVLGTAPRWTVLGRVLNAEDRSRNTSAFGLVFDTDTERNIQLGRSWGRRRLGRQECYVSESALDEIGVRGGVGERVVYRVELAALLRLGNVAVGSGGGGAGDGAGEQVLALMRLLGLDGASVGDGDGLVDVQVGPALRALLETLGLEEAVTLPPLDGVTAQVNASLLVEAALLAVIGNTAGEGIVSDGSGIALEHEATVVEAVRAPMGKWPVAMGNVVVLEAEEVALLLRDAVLGVLDGVVALFGGVLGAAGLEENIEDLRTSVAAFDYSAMQQFAVQVQVQYSDRMAMYLDRSDNVLEELYDFSDSVADSLSHTYPATFLTPLGTALRGVRFIKLFLDQIFAAVVFVLALVGVMVIYSLMLGDVEEKTYEYGMLRALGMQHTTLTNVLVASTAAFAIPGLILGLFFASMLYILVAFFVDVLASIKLDYSMPASGWIYGILLGILVPAIANVVPVRRALGSSLRDALDLYHQSAADVVVKVVRLDTLGLDPPQTVLAVMLTAIGFTTYFLLPLSFALGDFAFFLAILNAILMCMLLGLALVAQILQPFFETLMLRLMLACSRDANFLTIIRKNLAGHRPRNRKTAWMVSMSTAFLTFCGAMFALQSASIRDTVRLFLGADVVIDAPGSSEQGQDPVGLPQEDLSRYLHSVTVGHKDAGEDPVVAGHTYVTYELYRVQPVLWNTFSNLIGQPNPWVDTYGLERNYLQVAYSEYTTVTEVLPPSPNTDDIVKALHDDEGDLRLPIERSVDTDDKNEWVLVKSGVSVPRVYACNISTIDELANKEEKAREEEGDAAADALSHTYVQDCLEECGVEGICYELTPAFNLTARTNAAKESYEKYEPVLMTEAYRDFAGVDVATPMQLQIATRDFDAGVGVNLVWLAKARAMVSKVPGFFFSPYQQSAWGAPLLIPMDRYERLRDDAEVVLESAIADGTAVARDIGEDEDDEADVPVRAGAAAGAILRARVPRGAYAAGGSRWFRGTLEEDAVDGGWVSGEIVSGNLSFIADNDTSTELEWEKASTTKKGVWVRVDLHECMAVSEVRLFPGSTQEQRVRFELQSSPLTTVLTADAATDASTWSTLLTSSLSTTQTFHAYLLERDWAARHWRLYFPDATDSASVAELNLRVRPSSFCNNAVGSSSSTSIPKERLLIKMKSGSSERSRRRVINAVRSLLPDDTYTVQDTESLLVSTETAILALSYFFNFLAIVVGILIFLAAIVSWAATVRENAVELGILRALGLTAPQVTRIYIYEALAVMLAAFVLGGGVGMLVSVAITLQFNLFTQQDFILRLPYATLAILFFAFCGIAVFAAGWPARSYANAKIASVVKGRADPADA